MITFLLLHEKEKTATVDIPKFYIRRGLRIWPLYFFYIFIVLLVTIPILNNNWLYYVLFSGNIALAFKVTYLYLAHYWSLGVEE